MKCWTKVWSNSATGQEKQHAEITHGPGGEGYINRDCHSTSGQCKIDIDRSNLVNRINFNVSEQTDLRQKTQELWQSSTVLLCSRHWVDRLRNAPDWEGSVKRPFPESGMEAVSAHSKKRIWTFRNFCSENAPSCRQFDDFILTYSKQTVDKGVFATEIWLKSRFSF